MRATTGTVAPIACFSRDDDALRNRHPGLPAAPVPRRGGLIRGGTVAGPGGRDRDRERPLSARRNSPARDARGFDVSHRALRAARERRPRGGTEPRCAVPARAAPGARVVL